MTSLDALNPSTAQDSNGPGEWAEANPVNDPSLNALLANLQEGTLLSLMEDHDLFSDLNAYPLSPCEGGSGMGDQSSNDLDLKELLGDQWQLVDLELNDQSLELPLPLGSNDCDVAKLAKGKSEGLLVPNFQDDYASGKKNSCADATLREAFLTQTTSETVRSESESNLSPCEVAEAKPTPVTQQQQAPSFTVMREDSLASCRKRLKVSRHQRDLSSSGSDSDISSSNDSDAMECEELGEPQAGVIRVASRGMAAVATGHKHILACVQHDHPYATTQHPSGGQRSPVFTDGGDAGMEEGSNSDAGTYIVHMRGGFSGMMYMYLCSLLISLVHRVRDHVSLYFTREPQQQYHHSYQTNTFIQTLSSITTFILPSAPPTPPTTGWKCGPCGFDRCQNQGICRHTLYMSPSEYLI